MYGFIYATEKIAGLLLAQPTADSLYTIYSEINSPKPLTRTISCFLDELLRYINSTQNPIQLVPNTAWCNTKPSFFLRGNTKPSFAQLIPAAFFS
jgi:hypothetical protein